MNFDIISNIPLYYSISFINDVERVITKNTDIGTSQIVQEIGLFISRLNCGLHNLSNDNILVDGVDLSFSIENIGVVFFNKIFKDNTMSIFIKNIQWNFEGCYLYPNLTETKHSQLKYALSLIERMDGLFRPPIQ